MARDGVMRASLFLVPFLLLAWAGLTGCDSGSPAAEGFERVTIDGRSFDLELAVDAPTRTKGLSGRSVIDPEGGMLFVFPDAQKRSFVMRDCPVPIDIIFLDGTGRVTATHAMQPDPRRSGETDIAYEARLKKYPSRFASQFVVELAGGTLETLTVEPQQMIELDTARLKELAR
ncbi:MAG: DUF192 domain-containing protein [Planctomycetota bacterium]